eukprot:CAMPEP_0119160502 /NCGR_PEP_ID=MMETSP1315-20130426/422_1 /TAXON_ID=676789 /ORGANISM="Prasinoderma singularis, Strain RCC927" /LENGTH=347 /DNA_ID=CAMNT_0007153159 /DNA_START=156 /DNA_END=1199 /DNA_ORIENTATION=+
MVVIVLSACPSPPKGCARSDRLAPLCRRRPNAAAVAAAPSFSTSSECFEPCDLSTSAAGRSPSPNPPSDPRHTAGRRLSAVAPGLPGALPLGAAPNVAAVVRRCISALERVVCRRLPICRTLPTGAVVVLARTCMPPAVGPSSSAVKSSSSSSEPAAAAGFAMAGPPGPAPLLRPNGLGLMRPPINSPALSGLSGVKFLIGMGLSPRPWNGEPGEEGFSRLPRRATAPAGGANFTGDPKGDEITSASDASAGMALPAPPSPPMSVCATRAPGRESADGFACAATALLAPCAASLSTSVTAVMLASPCSSAAAWSPAAGASFAAAAEAFALRCCASRQSAASFFAAWA